MTQIQLWCTLCLLFAFNGLTSAKGTHKVHCSEDQMRVDIGIPDVADKANEKPKIYLEGLKDYPDERCHPEINASLAVFRLSLSDFYECGLTRMVNQITGKKVYYHKIIIESPNSKEIVGVKCITTTTIVTSQNSTSENESHLDQPLVRHHGVVRRDVLPAGFQEPEDLEIITSFTKHAPEPRLTIGVSQDGQEFTTDLTVKSGTPLTMEIHLDPESSAIYGLGVNYLDVTDTHASSETLIFKGCTVDPYLFENFNTVDGDSLRAKFKAFKFPDSSYVQFRATVNVCLDKCLGTQCSNNQIGYGRRKREIMPALKDTNKVYEFSLGLFIKVNDIEGVDKNEILHLEEKLRELKLANQRLARNSRGSFGETYKIYEHTSMAMPAFVVEEQELTQAKSISAAPASNLATSLALLSLICRFI